MKVNHYSQDIVLQQFNLAKYTALSRRTINIINNAKTEAKTRRKSFMRSQTKIIESELDGVITPHNYRNTHQMNISRRTYNTTVTKTTSVIDP